MSRLRGACVSRRRTSPRETAPRANGPRYRWRRAATVKGAGSGPRDHLRDCRAIGPDLFRHACIMGLEGLVSKRKDSRYKAGDSPDWIKVKNPTSPAMNRAKDAFS